MAQSKILVGLEIGTTKTCMVVGEIRPDATATIIGIGEVKSVGVRKGEVAELSMARQCVCDAWQLAQDHADVDILNVFLSVTGEHIVGENNVGYFRLQDNESIIEDEHAYAAKEKAEKLELSKDRFIVNRELGGFSIDGGEPTRHPAGLGGRTIDVNCHIMHGIRSRLQNSLLCVRQVPLEVEDLVFAPLATAQMVLTRQQKDSGSLLIDIGGGTTDFICYKGGDVVASGCIPMGGNNINQEIARLTDQRVSFKAAEVLKRTEGNAFGDIKDHSLAQYKSELGMHDVSIERGQLNRIIRNSLAAMLLQVRDRIPSELLNPGMGIYLSGGTSFMRGLDGLCQYIFGGMPVHQPAPLPPGHNHSYLADPRYCTAIGLIRYAQRYDDDAINPRSGNMLARFLKFLRGGR
ncbi:MAG: cell division protein FtsA [Akkermansia sp.]|nr:cell division protein FtsA [Akkermansia sp.]MBR6576695.1 cell division protein FtsA [Akkermansia sp.]